MPSRFVAMSNAERQRRFRKSHPGYYARLHRKRRGISKAKLRQQKAAAAEQIQAEIKARSRAQAELLAQAKAIVASFNRPPTRLMLPAPTIDPLAAEIAALAEKRKTRVAVVCKFKAESFPGVPVCEAT